MHCSDSFQTDLEAHLSYKQMVHSSFLIKEKTLQNELEMKDGSNFVENIFTIKGDPELCL